MAEEAAPQISINDLQNVVKVIDAAAERGAFKGNELTAVGAVRDKVAAFLAAIPPTEEETVAEPATTEEPAPAAKSARRKTKA